MRSGISAAPGFSLLGTRFGILFTAEVSLLDRSWNFRKTGWTWNSDADDEAWDLDGLFVEPRVMGRGVGRALVQDVAGRARGTGAREVSVVANPQASGFYERLGFRAGDEVETRFGPARRMSRPV